MKLTIKVNFAFNLGLRDVDNGKTAYKWYNIGMKNTSENRAWEMENLWRAVISVGMLAVIVVTAYTIESNIDSTRNLGALAPQNRLHHPNFHRPMMTDPNAISTWMTFDYLNMVFKMPPDYLKNNLNINNQKYPRLTIKQWAAQSKIDQALALTEIKAAIKTYAATKNTPAK